MGNFVIAIDGPAGSGKGTIAYEIARHYNYYYIDTGAFYRAITYLILKNDISLTDTDAILALADNAHFSFKGNHLILDGIDITDQLRSKEVEKIVSQVSCIKEIRLILNRHILSLAQDKDIVADGRDTTTVIFPNASVKIYLDARLEARIKRRYDQNKAKDIDSSYDEIRENIEMRDRRDQMKTFGALTLAPDAHYIDTTNLSIEDIINKIINIIEGEVK